MIEQCDPVKMLDDLYKERTRRPLWYMLDNNKNIVPTKNIENWGAFMEDRSKKIVRKERIESFLISTVFLGIDHGLPVLYEQSKYKPILFETMIFSDTDDWFSDVCERYCTYDEALACHKVIVTVVKYYIISKASFDKWRGYNKKLKKNWRTAFASMLRAYRSRMEFTKIFNFQALEDSI